MRTPFLFKILSQQDRFTWSVHQLPEHSLKSPSQFVVFYRKDPVNKIYSLKTCLRLCSWCFRLHNIQVTDWSVLTGQLLINTVIRTAFSFYSRMKISVCFFRLYSVFVSQIWTINVVGYISLYVRSTYSCMNMCLSCLFLSAVISRQLLYMIEWDRHHCIQHTIRFFTGRQDGVCRKTRDRLKLVDSYCGFAKLSSVILLRKESSNHVAHITLCTYQALV